MAAPASSPAADDPQPIRRRSVPAVVTSPIEPHMTADERAGIGIALGSPTNSNETYGPRVKPFLGVDESTPVRETDVMGSANFPMISNAPPEIAAVSRSGFPSQRANVAPLADVVTQQSQKSHAQQYSNEGQSSQALPGTPNAAPQTPLHCATAQNRPMSQPASATWPLEEGEVVVDPVPQLQYHHQPAPGPSPPVSRGKDPRMSSTPDLLAQGNAIRRHLTPTNSWRSSSLPRPQSTFSQSSDPGRSSVYNEKSHMRVHSSQSRSSPDLRPTSYAELLKVPYPQPAPTPLVLDNSHLRNNVGSNASLLSSQRTLEMYRQNVKKTSDMSIQYSFAVLLIASAREQGLDLTPQRKRRSSKIPKEAESASTEEPALPIGLVIEAKTILQKLSNAGYPFAQYYLADGYTSGLFSKGKEDYGAAFPLFVLAAKHGHAEAAYRTGLCYEFGWGCRKDPIKAVQFLRTAASKRHPGAMTRLGKACLSGDLGEKRYREGIKWLKLATESADSIYNAAPYHLACLYETGYGDDIFKDESYAAELFTQAAELGHAEAGFRIGDAYEHGRLNCPQDAALSVHFYTGAAEKGHVAAMMGLCAWYIVGAPPVLEMDEEEAFEWAHRAAEIGYVKAQYTVGYFTEMGIGCRRDILEANVWYVAAADAGDERAKQRLGAIRAAASGGGLPMEVGPAKDSKLRRRGTGDEKNSDCKVM